MIPNPVPQSILIFLNTRLEILELDFVNKRLDLLDQLEPTTPDSKILNLGQRFEPLWDNLWTNLLGISTAHTEAIGQNQTELTLENKTVDTKPNQLDLSTVADRDQDSLGNQTNLSLSCPLPVSNQSPIDPQAKSATLPTLDTSPLRSVYYLLGPQAGFTDSRVIFLWLKSLSMFYPETKFYLLSLTDPIHPTKLDFDLLAKILSQAMLNPTSLTYTRQPRLGPSKSNPRVKD
jgi:hypothetical protein